MTKLPYILVTVILLLSMGMISCGSEGGDPEVDILTPPDGAEEIDLFAPLSITFDEDVTLINSESIFISGGITGISATLEDDNRTLTITHDPFHEKTEYWWRILEGTVQDIDGEPNKIEEWSFTTMEVGAPSIISTNPDNGAGDVDLSAPLSITFNEDITLLDTGGGFISGGIGGISTTLEDDNRTLTVTHDPFMETTEYWWGISGGSVQDADGYSNIGYNWIFTTMEVGAPSIDNTNPDNGATDIDLSAPLSITFNEDITLLNEEGIFISGGVTGISATLEDDNRTLTITHDPFMETTEYWWRILEGTVQDIDDNSNTLVERSFTTMEVGEPSVDTINPDNGATDVDLSAPLSITFDEDITLFDPEGVFVGGGATGIAASLEEDNKTLTISHDRFMESKEYWWGINAGAVQDAEENPNAKHSWVFTTMDVDGPSVISTTPDMSSTDVALDTSVSATFSKPITQGPNYNDILIWNDQQAYVPGVTISIDENTLTINFTHSDFEKLTTYYPEIPVGSVQDSDGNLNEYYQWEFTTTEVGPPQVVSTIPASSEIGIDVSSPLIVTFDEDIFLYDRQGIFISGGVNVISATVDSDNRTVTITHDTFNESTEYWWGISEGAIWDDDRNVNVNYEWSFTTQ